MKNNLSNKAILLMIASAMMLSSACGKDTPQNESSIDITSETDEKSTAEIETASNFEINSNDYIGYWHMEGCAEIELTIDSVTSSVVSFSLWLYGEGATDFIGAELNGNTASFQSDEISGRLILEDKYIMLCIDSSNTHIVPSNVEMKFDMRVLESVQKQNDLSSSKAQMNIVEITPQKNTIEIIPLNQTIYGQINCQGLSVSGVTTSYVCEGGDYSTVRNHLGDKWHIKSDRTCYNYGILWYECYDSQDGDYYGWIDSEYLEFVDSEIQKPTIESNTKIPPIQTTTSKVMTVDKTEPVATQPSSKYTPTVISKQVKGVNFNYINKFHKYYEYIDETMDFDIDITIKYCEPSDYISDTNHLTGIYNKNGIYNKEDIGNVYYSAGTDDFAIFEVTFNGTYSGANIYYDRYGILQECGIMYSKYTSGGSLLSNANGDTKHPLCLINTTDGTINQTVYIGLYTSEVSSIDFIMFDIGPDYEDIW